MCLNSLLRNPKDFFSGIIYVVIGLGAVFIARDYGMGAALKMGPGYFPVILGGALTLIGVASLIRSFLRPGSRIGAFAAKGLMLVLVGTLLTGFLVRNAGLVVALPVLVLITAYASIKFRWGPTLALTVGLTIFCILIFVKGLGLPLPLLGPWFGG